MDSDFKIQKLDITQKQRNDVIGTSGKVEMRRINSTRTNSQSKWKRFVRSRNFKILVGVVVILLIIAIYTLIKGLAIYKSAKTTVAQAKVTEAALKAQNIVQAQTELQKTKTDIADLQKNVNSIGYIGWIPLLGGYYNDGRHLVNAGSDGVDAAIVATKSLIPYADVLGLQGQHSFAGSSAEDRIRLAVQTLGKVVPQIDEIEGHITDASNEVSSVNPNRYPNFGPFKKIRGYITEAKDLTQASAQIVAQGKPLIKALPSLLGQDTTKKYLILFQNDKELRPTGGFLTFYSVFNVNDGIITVDTSGDIYTLDASIPSHPAAPDIIAKYLPGVNQWYIRDSNTSPDFVESMKNFDTFYQRSSLKQNVDGIIAIDTGFLVDTLKVLGGVDADGSTYTADNDPHCDCPQVVYSLESQADQAVNYVKTNRKGVVGDLMFAILEKALKSSPKQYWGPLFQTAIADLQQKHILVDVNDPNAQKGIESLNWAGRVRDYNGDYLNINDANFGGAKSNMYTSQSVVVNYQKDGDGTITKTVTITYKNDHPYSDCNLEHVGNLCLNATLRDLQRVYVPKGSTLVSSKGSEVKVTTADDLGKTYFQGFFRVNPQGKSEVIYTYKLPFKLNGSDLPVLIQKQPGTPSLTNVTDPSGASITAAPQYEIDINGNMVQQFQLDTDKEITLKF